MQLLKQEAFEKCWAHSPLRAAARRLFYIAIHQVSLLSHAACASMSTTTSTTTTTRDRGDRYGPMEWAQSRVIADSRPTVNYFMVRAVTGSHTHMYVTIEIQAEMCSTSNLSFAMLLKTKTSSALQRWPVRTVEPRVRKKNYRRRSTLLVGVTSV